MRVGWCRSGKVGIGESEGGFSKSTARRAFEHLSFSLGLTPPTSTVSGRYHQLWRKEEEKVRRLKTVEWWCCCRVGCFVRMCVFLFSSSHPETFFFFLIVVNKPPFGHCARERYEPSSTAIAAPHLSSKKRKAQEEKEEETQTLQLLSNQSIKLNQPKQKDGFQHIFIIIIIIRRRCSSGVGVDQQM